MQHLSSLRQRPVHRAGVAADDTSVQQRGDRALRHCGDGHAEDATDLFQPGHGRGGGDDVAGGEFAREQRGKRAEGEHVRCWRERGQGRLGRYAVAQFSVEIVLDDYRASASLPRRSLGRFAAFRRLDLVEQVLVDGDSDGGTRAECLRDLIRRANDVANRPQSRL